MVRVQSEHCAVRWWAHPPVTVVFRQLPGAGLSQEKHLPMPMRLSSPVQCLELSAHPHTSPASQQSWGLRHSLISALKDVTRGRRNSMAMGGEGRWDWTPGQGFTSPLLLFPFSPSLCYELRSKDILTNAPQVMQILWHQAIKTYTVDSMEFECVASKVDTHYGFGFVCVNIWGELYHHFNELNKHLNQILTWNVQQKYSCCQEETS